jgi:hypothetical protein
MTISFARHQFPPSIIRHGDHGSIQWLGAVSSQYLAVRRPWRTRRLIRGASNVPEALVSKTCTPCRGGIPPLTREEAQLFQPQTPDWRLAEEAHRIERSFRFRDFREALTFVQEIGELAEAEGHHPNSASVGAMQRSLCRPRRSRDCMRTTSSWRPRSTAYTLGLRECERLRAVRSLRALRASSAGFRACRCG